MSEFSFKAIVEMIVIAEPTRFRIAFNEADATNDLEIDAQHFLKMEGKRLGRDIKLYDFMAQVMGLGGALVHFLQEVVLPLGSESAAFIGAADKLKEWGQVVFEGETLNKWQELF